jgi:hypothetical protein
MAFPAIELNGVPLWGFTYRVITEWLGLHAQHSPGEYAGFAAARLILEFLLAHGLKLQQPWNQRNGIQVAVVKGPIPVAGVLERFSLPARQIPPLSVLEVRPESIRIVGLAQEEYLIATADQ